MLALSGSEDEGSLSGSEVGEVEVDVEAVEEAEEVEEEEEKGDGKVMGWDEVETMAARIAATMVGELGEGVMKNWVLEEKEGEKQKGEADLELGGEIGNIVDRRRSDGGAKMVKDKNGITRLISKDRVISKKNMEEMFAENASSDVSRVVRTKTQKKKKRANDIGAGWFHMQTPEITKELRDDLRLLQNRQALDPKRFYKKESRELPKHFQMGTVVEARSEGTQGRIQKRQRGRTLAEELFRDVDLQQDVKRRFLKIQDSKPTRSRKIRRKQR